eukprot:m.244330 g.244330  ORF g.244330 m.244330 type:complete len:88 (+) comp33825_c0_seq4:3873-4136(+)
MAATTSGPERIDCQQHKEPVVRERRTLLKLRLTVLMLVQDFAQSLNTLATAPLKQVVVSEANIYGAAREDTGTCMLSACMHIHTNTN